MTLSSDSTPIWQHLLFPNIASEDVLVAIRNALENNGYSSYDPFPGGIGSPIGKQTRIRAFAAPPSEGWQSIFFAPNDGVAASILTDFAMSINSPFLDLRLYSLEDYQITVYDVDTATTNLSSLLPFLKLGLNMSDLESAQYEPSPSASESTSPPNLPPELQQFADKKGVQSKHVDKLMGRMTKRIFKKMEQRSGDSSDSTQEQAKAMLSGQVQDALNSSAGQKLRSIISCLTVPDDWDLPDWKTLVAAYPIARQLQKGDALLLPGDEAALKEVPNALEFTPLYYAKRTT